MRQRASHADWRTTGRCAGGGDVIKHGLNCDCPVIYGEKKDPEPLGRPHINFAANA